MSFNLKSNCYVTKSDAAAWLKLKEEKITVGNANYDSQLDSALTLIINAATDKVEQYTQTNILVKQFVEDFDGNNSNVVIPSRWPVTELVSIKIDHLRNFDTATALDPINFFLRGQADKRQTSMSMRIIGQDLVLRDDNEKYILGRIFIGSSLGSIRVTYKAGWGTDTDDVPSDLKMATLQLIEFYFMQRDNRDLNVTSKSVKGESYSRVTKDIPEQILEILDSYKDVSLGSHAMPQKNTFKI